MGTIDDMINAGKFDEAQVAMREGIANQLIEKIKRHVQAGQGRDAVATYRQLEGYRTQGNHLAIVDTRTQAYETACAQVFSEAQEQMAQGAVDAAVAACDEYVEIATEYGTRNAAKDRTEELVGFWFDRAIDTEYPEVEDPFDFTNEVLESLGAQYRIGPVVSIERNCGGLGADFGESTQVRQGEVGVYTRGKHTGEGDIEVSLSKALEVYADTFRW